MKTPRPASPPGRVLIVDEELRDSRGHTGNFIRGMLEYLVGTGADVEVWGHCEVTPAAWEVAGVRVRPMFRRVWMDAIFRPQRGGRVVSVLRHNWQLLGTLVRGGALTRPPELTIATSVHLYHLLAWRVWLALVPRRCRLVLVVLRQPWLIRTEVSGRWEFTRVARIYRPLLRSFRRSARNGQCCLATEARFTSRLLRHLSGVPSVLIAMPRPTVWTTLRRDLGQSRAPTAPLRIGFLGRTTADKGFEMLLEMIERRCRKPTPGASVVFVIQWSEVPGNPPHWKKRLSALVQGFPEAIERVEGDLTVDAYAAMIASLDGLLLPYWRSDYIGRGSSLALDAYCAGVPVVFTAGTWVAETVGRWGAGVACRDRDAESLAVAVETLVQNVDSLAARARAQAEVARREVSWPEFFARVAPAGLPRVNATKVASSTGLAQLGS